MVDISVLGLSLQEEGKTPLLLLHPNGSQTILALDIGPMEAFAISLALHGRHVEEAAGRGVKKSRKIFPRPLTHDLLLGILESVEAIISEVHLTSVVDGTFLAEALILHDGRVTALDCRPSDGVALALRCNAPIKASRDVATRARDIEEVMAALPEHVRSMAAAKLASLPVEFPQPGPGSRRERAPVPRLPRAVEEALAAKLAGGGRDPRQELISVAHRMIGEEQAKGRTDISAGLEQLLAVLGRAAPDGREKDPSGPDHTAPDEVPPEEHARPGRESRTVRAPRIKVSLIRATGGKEEARLPDAMPRTSGPLLGGEIGDPFPEAALALLGLSPREADAVNEAGEEERWAMLLRILAPETKVPM